MKSINVRVAPLLAAILALAGAAGATSVQQTNIVEMGQTAERVFVGKVLSAKEITVALGKKGVPAVEYVFQISEAIKGVEGETIAIRQVGRLTRDPVTGASLGVPPMIVGMPEYRVGKEYLLFLRGDSEAGLASPIGFHQGWFVRGKNLNGEETFVNGAGNAGLFRGVATRERSNRVTATISNSETEELSGEVELSESEVSLINTPRLGPMPADDILGLARKFSGATMAKTARSA